MKQFNRLAKVWEAQLPEGESELADFEHAFFPEFLAQAKNAKKILEIGAGRGRMVRVLRQHGVTAEFYCVDLNDYVRESDGYAVIGNAISLPFRDECFDLVYSLGVIEHFPETHIALAEHVRVLKKGGTMLVTVPHLSLYTPLRWLVWLIKFRPSGSFEQTLGRNLTLKFLRNEMKKNRAQVTSYRAGGVFLPSVFRYMKAVVEKFSQKINLVRIAGL